MGEVDPDDDSLRRFVVRLHRYDPVRRERRHVVVAALDNEAESDASLDEVQADLIRRQAAGGPDADPREHVSGVVLEPGHRRLQHNARMLQRAIQHGVLPKDWEHLELPPNVGILTAGRRDQPVPWWRRLLSWPRPRP